MDKLLVDKLLYIYIYILYHCISVVHEVLIINTVILSITMHDTILCGIFL